MRAEFETKKAKLDGYASLVENYENGFLRETKALDKDIMAIAEYSMRILEKLDGYLIAEVIFIQTSAQFTPKSLTVSDFFLVLWLVTDINFTWYFLYAVVFQNLTTIN